MTGDLSIQLDLAGRLLIAALLGALVGLEREIHQHPAGTRTHLLVSLGSALFTEMSAAGFGQASGSVPTIDPTRIAAQIVSGIGFLGAGAILKYGTSIRGLTTAASLWVTASIGLAVGAGEWVLAAICTAIVVLSLGPLNLVVVRLRIGRNSALRLRVALTELERVGAVSQELRRQRVEITGIGTQRVAKGRYEVEFDVRVPPGVRPDDLLEVLERIPDVEVLESAAPSD